MTIPHNTLVLVADGSRMLFLRNRGGGDVIELVTEAQSGSLGRPAVEETDFHQLEEDRFAAEAADQLRHRALGGDFDDLVLVAPPKTLGELRKHLHKEVESRVIMELPKEMTNRPLPDIAAMLMGRSETPG